MDERKEIELQAEEQTAQATDAQQAADAATEKEYNPDPQMVGRSFLMILSGGFIIYIAWQMARALFTGGRSLLSALGLGASALFLAGCGVFLIYFYGKRMLEK